jgi:hypothetical protein
MLDKSNGTKEFYTSHRINSFTGLYFSDENTFFALYPSPSGPQIYFNNMEYSINKNLSIELHKNGKNRLFSIKDFGIEINYLESQYMGFDVWSEEADVDLFYMLLQNYKTDEFYEGYTSK